jgi:hypothetical protein
MPFTVTRKTAIGLPSSSRKMEPGTRMVRKIEVTDVVDAVLYLARAPQVSGEVLHLDLDGGAHAGRW